MDPIDELERDYRAYLARRRGSETAADHYRALMAVSECTALEAVSAGDDCRAVRYFCLAEAFGNIAEALDSSDGTKVMEMVQ